MLSVLRVMLCPLNRLRLKSEFELYVCVIVNKYEMSYTHVSDSTEK